MSAMTSSHADGDEYFATRLPWDRRRNVLWQTLWKHRFQAWVAPEDTVLDLGAGYCDFINAVVAKRRIAIDRWSEFGRYAQSGVIVHVNELPNLECVPRESVDFAFASNLFEHLTHPVLHETLAQLRTRLTAKGRLCVLMPNYRYCYREFYDDYTHVSPFSDVSMRDFLSASGYRVTECQPRFLPLTIKSRLPVHPLLIRTYLRLPYRPLGKQMLLLAEPA